MAEATEVLALRGTAIEGQEVTLTSPVTGLAPGIPSIEGQIRTIVGIACVCQSTAGVLIVRIRNAVVAVLDLACLTVTGTPVQVNIPVPLGDIAQFTVLSSSGTGVAYVHVQTAVRG